MTGFKTVNKSYQPSRRGNLSLYAIILVLIGLGFAIFVFTPEYRDVQRGIYTVSCQEIIMKINSAIEDYNINNSKSYTKPAGVIVDLDTLKEKGYLGEIKYCPQKGRFIFDEKGKVVCTIHSKGK